jgi:hypothetical protein
MVEEPSFGWAERTHKFVSAEQEDESILEESHTDSVVAQSTVTRIKRVKRQERIETETRTVSL